MSNKYGKQRIAAADKLLKRVVTPFKVVNKEEAVKWPTGATRAFINERYVVTVYDDTPMSNGSTAIQVLIQNHFAKPIDNHWSEIQKIKNELFGAETTAIEYFPAASELVDNHNIYWIFIFPDGMIPKKVMQYAGA